MSAEQTPDIETVRRKVAAYICNTSNLPKPLQVPALGLHMGDLIDGLTEALAPVLAAAVREAKVRELRQVARDIEPRPHHCLRSQGCVECGRAKAHEAFIRFLNNRADRVAEHEAGGQPQGRRDSTDMSEHIIRIPLRGGDLTLTQNDAPDEDGFVTLTDPEVDMHVTLPAALADRLAEIGDVVTIWADRVAEPQHEAATSGKESEASDE